MDFMCIMWCIFVTLARTLRVKPNIRLHAKSPSSECMSQSVEHKHDFDTRSCVRANLVSVWFYFKFQGNHSDFDSDN